MCWRLFFKFLEIGAFKTQPSGALGREIGWWRVFGWLGDDIFIHLASVSLRVIFTRRCQEIRRYVALCSICPDLRRNFWNSFVFQAESNIYIALGVVRFPRHMCLTTLPSPTQRKPLDSDRYVEDHALRAWFTHFISEVGLSSYAAVFTTKLLLSVFNSIGL